MDGATNFDEAKQEFGRQLKSLQTRALLEFENIGDYIWKAPRLIDHERKIETLKLTNYPENSEEREYRRSVEFRKLDHTFPYLIAAGSLYSTVSIFEAYLLLLAAMLEKRTGKSIRDVSGNGVNRVFAYLRKVGVRPDDLPLFDQISAGIRIRNCMLHANGILDWSRDGSELRRIQKARLYLSKEHRQIRMERGRDTEEVTIGESSFGERLIVDNLYAHVFTSYLSNFFYSLCYRAYEVLEE